MAKKQETPVKAGILDRRDANRQGNRQKAALQRQRHPQVRQAHTAYRQGPASQAVSSNEFANLRRMSLH